ncbi:HEAT repeat domain-containing protein [Geotalea sp. SG265]|uniref:HEAT repeat domain-containing protein n=1 Tax=Geotalea sp. SG265 TaxID=2922867 RepID=UPI001FAEE94C|nr:HEAT repeat domain-containing protein [Geotalea sp. SG265]
MNKGTDSLLKLVLPRVGKDDPGSLLADIYKAMRAIGFYPEGHPKREEIVAGVYESLRQYLQEHELSLTISRGGFTAAGQAVRADANRMIVSLAGELFMRRVQQLIFLPDLSLEDLRAFLQLLSMDQKNLARGGGMAQLMPERGIRTIWANEIDLSVIWERRQALEEELKTAEASGDGDLSAEAENAEGETGTAPAGDDKPDTDSLMELLARMDRETNDSRYQQFARNLAAKAEDCKGRGVCAPLFLVLHGLLEHSADTGRSQVQRDYAAFTLEQVADGVMTDFLLQHLESKSAQEAAKIYPVLKKLGAKIAYVIIQRLCLADGLQARKSLAAALLAIGPAAVPPLLAMLKDERWYVVRNMVAILGQIGCRESANALRPALYHGDQRVRKETLHALVKTGGDNAESMVIELLDDKDAAVVLHAIMSLGLLKSKKAVQLLIDIVEKPDFFSAQLKKKKEAIVALGRIGDRRAASPLLRVLESHSWLPWSKWDELKVFTATALGRIGDETVLPALKACAAKGGTLGKACSEAVDTIERVAEDIYE